MLATQLLLHIGFAVESVRENGPVVQGVVPREATPFVADVLSAAGAAPVLTGTTPDALAALAFSDALALDLGTLSVEGSEGLTAAIAQAHEGALTWVLEASRLGRAPLSQQRMQDLVFLRPTVVRGRAADRAELRLGEHQGAVVLTGDTDEVTLGGQTLHVARGAELLDRIAGVRAATAALTAACATVADPLVAAAAGAAWLSVASVKAAEQASGPAAFRVALVDAVASVRGDEVAESLMNA